MVAGYGVGLWSKAMSVGHALWLVLEIPICSESLEFLIVFGVVGVSEYFLFLVSHFLALPFWIVRCGAFCCLECCCKDGDNKVYNSFLT